EGGSVDAFDRLRELMQAHVEVRVLVGQHEGFVYTGKRQILGVLQQAGRTHRQGVTHFRQKCPEVFARRQRERCSQEAPFNLGVISAVNGEIEKVVLAEELVERIGRQHNRRRHCNLDASEATGHPVAVQQVAYKSQAASLATQRTTPNSQEERLRRLECC